MDLQIKTHLSYWILIGLLHSDVTNRISLLFTHLFMQPSFDVPLSQDFSEDLFTDEIQTVLKKTNFTVDEAKAILNKNDFVFIDGENVRRWLIKYGAKEDELTAMENGKVHSTLERDYAPNMYFRDVAIQRNLLIDNGVSRDGEIKRLLKHAGVRSVQRFYENEVASTSNDGAKVAVKRSGDRQFWPIPPDNYVKSTIPYAFSRLMEAFISGVPHELQGTNKDSNFTIQDQILIRINKRTDEYECPTPEGLHQDGQELVGITLTGFHNLESGGETRLWPAAVPRGNYDDEEFENPNSPYYKGNCLLNRPLRHHWDTVIANDRRIKHEVRPFDGKRPAYRDVIVNEIRKPYSDGVDQMLNEDGHVVSIE